jgi:hypothetical protein
MVVMRMDVAGLVHLPPHLTARAGARSDGAVSGDSGASHQVHPIK